MEGLAAIDEELAALGEGRDDVDAIIAKAHADLPDHSESFEIVDAMLENLGEAVSIPTVEPVGIDIPKPEMPEIQAVPEPVLAEVGAISEPEIPDTNVHPSVPPAEEPKSAVELAAEADAGVDAMVGDGLESESGLDADDLFGDLGPDSQMTPTEDAVDLSAALAQVRAMTSEMPPAGTEAAEPAAEAAPPPEAPPQTEPPPPPVEAGARDSIEELDLDEIMIEDDEFELMIEEDDGDTFVGDADAVEAALAEPKPRTVPPPPPAEATGDGDGDGDDDDPREQSFFKKLFG